MESLYYSHYGDLYQSLGRWSDAAASLQKAIEIGLQQANPPYNYLALGRLYAQSGNFALAKEYLEQIDISREDSLYYPGKYWHTVWLLDFANLYVAWGEPDQALFYSRQARSFAEKQGHPTLLGQALKTEGSAQLQLEEWEAAKDTLTQALALFRQESAIAHECTALNQLIQLHLLQEDEEEITTCSENIWNLLNSGKLDMTTAEPIKAWWSCFLAFRALGDAREVETIRIANQLLETQLANIQDEAWRDKFLNQVPEHRTLARVARDLYANLM